MLLIKKKDFENKDVFLLFFLGNRISHRYMMRYMYRFTNKIGLIMQNIFGFKSMKSKNILL